MINVAVSLLLSLALTSGSHSPPPPPKRVVSPMKEFVEGLKGWESYRPYPYTCSGGVRTIGYGCTDPKVVAKGYVSEAEATKHLLREVNEAMSHVDEVVTVELTYHQKLALTSFTHNLGRSNLIKLVDGDGRLNDGSFQSVETYLPMYRKAGGKVRQGLVKRRAWELELWRR